jgi:hypothetical protein
MYHVILDPQAKTNTPLIGAPVPEDYRINDGGYS